MNNKSVIRMEKRATNKIGLFFLLLISIIGFSVGGYLLYQNRDNIDFTLPWNKKDEDKAEKEDKPKPEKNENNTSGGKLYLPEISPETNLLRQDKSTAKLNITSLKATKEGYVLELKLTNVEFKGTIKIDCEKILIDEYELTPTFQMELVTESETDKTTKVTLPIAELENLEINNFRSLSFFINALYIGNRDTEEDTKPIKSKTIVTAFQDKFVDNTKETLTAFNAQDSVKIYYYKMLNVEDATYLYFLVDNTNKENNHQIEIKKLLVNQKIYNTPSINVKSHHNSKTTFFIKIPRKDFQTVEEVTASFAITRKVGEDTAVFFTRDEKLKLTK